MRRAMALLLMAACGGDPRLVRIQLITPVDEDPTATVEEYMLSAEHPDLGGARQTFAAGEAPFELPAIEPGDGWVFEVEGRVLDAPWALGRSCPTDIPAEGELPEPVIYFSLLRQFARAGALDGPRTWPAVLPLTDGAVLALGGDPGGLPMRYAMDHAGFDRADGPVMGVVQVAQLDEGFLATGETSAAWRIGAAGDITEIAAPEAARVGARLAGLGDGRVLLSGGQSGATFQEETWIFGPQQGAFQPGPAATPRRDHTASEVGRDNVLLLGGRDAAGALVSAEVLTDQPPAFQLTPLAVARWQHTATVLAGDAGVLVAGGRGASGQPLADVEIYDPTGLGSRITLPAADSLAFARAGHTATPIAEGRFVLIAGGWGVDETPVATAELYDVERRQFRPTDDLLAPRAGQAALVLCDGKVLFVGGEGEGAQSAEIYNPDPGL